MLKQEKVVNYVKSRDLALCSKFTAGTHKILFPY